jgi:Zinc finger, C3HC4 type (RING finger)
MSSRIQYYTSTYVTPLSLTGRVLTSSDLADAYCTSTWYDHDLRLAAVEAHLAAIRVAPSSSATAPQAPGASSSNEFETEHGGHAAPIAVKVAAESAKEAMELEKRHAPPAPARYPPESTADDDLVNEENEQDACSLCAKRVRKAVMVECGCMYACVPCVRAVDRAKCQICDAPVVRVLRVNIVRL